MNMKQTIITILLALVTTTSVLAQNLIKTATTPVSFSKRDFADTIKTKVIDGAKLNSAVNDATIKIQFFTDQACTQPYPVPAQGQDPTIITLTMTEQTVGSFAADTDYWCKISVTVITSVLDTALTPSAAEQRPGDGKGSISFGVTFMATAESAM